ncbi:hypothetical protein [Nitrosomonas sp.]|nr:hypothetical protein [Nitrosomonas sp.]
MATWNGLQRQANSLIGWDHFVIELPPLEVCGQRAALTAIDSGL